MHTIKLNYKYPKEYDQHMVTSVPVKKVSFDENYSYYKRGLFYKIGRSIVYLLAYTVGYLVCKLKHGIRYVGRKNLKLYKSELKRGCITICNHVFRYDYICIMFGIRPHFQYYPSWNAKLLDKDRHLVNLTGGIPVPSNLAGLKKFLMAFDRHIKENAWIHFFPEAAMWPYYQRIRPFKKGAFVLAVKHNRPILPMAFRFRNPSKFARIFGIKEPLATLYIGKPIYPDTKIQDKKIRIKKLQHESYNAVMHLAGSSESLLEEKTA